VAASMTKAAKGAAVAALLKAQANKILHHKKDI